MANEDLLKAIFDSNRRSKKFHEGWVARLIPRERGMIQKLIDQWMVLRGNALLLFDGNAEESMRNLTDAIPLKETRRASSVVPGFSQQGFGLEIESLTPDGTRKYTSFLFKRENDRDFWKAFIVALSQGVIPNDVILLPGQVVSIRHAMSQMKEFPPPPGYQVSPVARVPFHDQHGQPGIADYQGRPQHGSNQVSPRSNLPVDQLAAEDLLRRQSALVDRELPLPANNLPHGGHMLYNRRDLGREFPRDSPNFGQSMDIRFPDRQTSTESRFHTMRPPKTMPQLETRRIEDASGWVYMNPTATVHPFYRDSALNTKYPTWFIDCSRDVSETVLLLGRRFGNVLMRPCTGNSPQTCYALSYRDDRATPGAARVSHFSVLRRPEGFKIDVDDEHSAMCCLSDVIQYFVSFVGPGTQPLNSNNLNEILGQGTRTIARPGMQPLQTTYANSVHTSPGICPPAQSQLTRSVSSPSKPSPYRRASESSSPNYLYMSSSQSLHSPFPPDVAQNQRSPSSRDSSTSALNSPTSSGSSEPLTSPYSFSQQPSSEAGQTAGSQFPRKSSSSGVHSPSESYEGRPYDTFSARLPPNPSVADPESPISTEPSPPSSPPFAMSQLLPAGSPPPPPPPPPPEALPAATLQRPVETENKPLKTTQAAAAKGPEKKDAFGNFQNELQSKLPKFWQSTYKPPSKP